VVAKDGVVETRLLHGLRMVEEELMAVVRQKGMKDLDEVRLAIVERDGNITLFKRE
jgi:uncharacterized membrane protein YcaP (DUF421 family)